MNLPFDRFYYPENGEYQLGTLKVLLFHYAVMSWRNKGITDIEVILDKKEKLEEFLRTCNLKQKIAIGNQYYIAWRKNETLSRQEIPITRMAAEPTH